MINDLFVLVDHVEDTAASIKLVQCSVRLSCRGLDYYFNRNGVRLGGFHL